MYSSAESVALALPRYLTPDPATLYKSGPQFGTTGVDADVVAAARGALKEMIDYLTTVHEISPYEAMVLCSVAADFKIAEVCFCSSLSTTRTSTTAPPCHPSAHGSPRSDFFRNVAWHHALEHQPSNRCMA